MSTDSNHMDFILSASRHQQQQYDTHHQQQQQQPQVYYNTGTSRPTPTECSPILSEGRASIGGDCSGVAPPNTNSTSMSAAAAAALLLQAAASTSSINGNVASSPNPGALRRCSITTNNTNLFERPERLSPSYPSASALTAAAQLAAAQAAGGGNTGTSTAISSSTTSDLQAAVLSLALAVQPPATTASASSSGSSDDPRQAVSDFLLLSKRHPELITSSLASVFRRRSSGALTTYPTTDGAALNESSGTGEPSDATSSPSTFLPPTLATALGVLTPQLTGNPCGMQNFSHPTTEADWEARGFSTLAAAAAATTSPPDITDASKMPGAKQNFSPNVYAYDSHHHRQQQPQHRYPVIHHRGGAGVPVTYFKHSPPAPQEQPLHSHISSSFNNYSTTSAGAGPSTAASYGLRPHGMSSLSPLPTGMLQSPPPPAAVAAPSLAQESSLSPLPPPLTCSSLAANEFAGSEFAYTSTGLPAGSLHAERMMESSGRGSAVLHDEQITPTSTGTATPDYSIISGGGGGGGGGGTGSVTTTACYPDDPNRKREQRLMKNREAARECRRKKKEYVKCLEARVSLLESQNQQLIEELNKVKALCLSELCCGLGLTGSTAACAAAVVLAAAGAVTAVPGTNYSSVPPVSSGAKPTSFQSPQDLEPSSLGSNNSGSQIGSVTLNDTPSPLRNHRAAGTVGGMHRRRPSLLSSTLVRHQNENGGELVMSVNAPQQSSSVDMLSGRYGPPVDSVCQPLHLQLDENNPSVMAVKKQRGSPVDTGSSSSSSYLMPTGSSNTAKSPMTENSVDMYHRRIRTSVSQGRSRGPNPFRSAVGGRRQQQQQPPPLSYSQQQSREGQHMESSTFQQPQIGSTAVKRGYHDLKSSDRADALVATSTKAGRFDTATGNNSSRGREHDPPNYSNSSNSSTSPSSCTATAS